MDLKALEKIGRAAYGSTWQTPLAEDVGVSYRTMRRWKMGKSRIPDTLRKDLIEVLEVRKKEIEEVLLHLKKE